MLHDVNCVTLDSELWQTNPRACLERGVVIPLDGSVRTFKIIDAPELCRTRPMVVWADSGSRDQLRPIHHSDQHTLYRVIGSRRKFNLFTGALMEFFEEKSLRFSTEPLSLDPNCKYIMYDDNGFFPPDSNGPFFDDDDDDDDDDDYDDDDDDTWGHD